jgi:hypothetical protein
MNNNESNLVVDFPPALYVLAPSLGPNVLAELESSNATDANVYEDGSSMNLQATLRGQRGANKSESQKGVGTDAITAIIPLYSR